MANRINFIFKHTQYIKGVGGKLPSNEETVGNVHIKGQKRGYYYLAECDDTDIQKLNKWEPMIVSQEVVTGFPLIDRTEVPVNSDDPEDDSMRALNAQELADQHAAEKALKKIELRSQIAGNVGDTADLLTDLAKRVGMLERVTMRTLDWLYKNSSIASEVPQSFKDGYGVLMTQYLSDIDSGALRDRVDIQDNTELYGKIKARYNAITDLVETYLNY